MSFSAIYKFSSIKFKSACIQFWKNQVFGVDSGEETPEPIPNSEVKLTSGDGIAELICGRVARCQFYGGPYGPPFFLPFSLQIPYTI